MEVNGRLRGSLPLAVHAGADIPAVLAAVHLGRRPPGAGLDTGYRVGVRSWNLDLELLWIASVLRGGHRHAALATPRRRGASRRPPAWSAADSATTCCAGTIPDQVPACATRSPTSTRKVRNGR